MRHQQPQVGDEKRLDDGLLRSALVELASALVFEAHQWPEGSQGNTTLRLAAAQVRLAAAQVRLAAALQQQPTEHTPEEAEAWLDAGHRTLIEWRRKRHIWEQMEVDRALVTD